MTSSCFSFVYMLTRFLSKQDTHFCTGNMHGVAILNMHHVYKRRLQSSVDQESGGHFAPTKRHFTPYKLSNLIPLIYIPIDKWSTLHQHSVKCQSDWDRSRLSPEVSLWSIDRHLTSDAFSAHDPRMPVMQSVYYMWDPFVGHEAT